MRRFGLLLPILLGLASPVLAAPDSQLEPERISEARKLVAALMPPGAMDKMMGGLGEIMSGQVLTRMAPEGDLAKARANDPYFDERVKRAMKVTLTITGEIIAKWEPNMREAMARAYARRLSLGQLKAANRFYSSPEGATFASTMYDLMKDPDVLQSSSAMMSELRGKQSDMVVRLTSAMADLPPPPKKIENRAK